MACEHTCAETNHLPVGASQFKLNCCTICMGCQQPISYGCMDEHLRNCHSDSSNILVFPVGRIVRESTQ